MELVSFVVAEVGGGVMRRVKMAQEASAHTDTAEWVPGLGDTTDSMKGGQHQVPKVPKLLSPGQTMSGCPDRTRG